MTYTGTVLGGPRDGDTITCERRVLLMPVLIDGPPQMRLAGAVVPPDTATMRYRTDAYDFRRDSDLRGWWIRRHT